MLDLEHGALAGPVREVEAFCDDTIHGYLGIVEPLLGLALVTGEGGDGQPRLLANAFEEILQRGSTHLKRLQQEGLACLAQQGNRRR